MLTNKPNPQRNSGFTLIEVLITILVVSIGLLGLAGLQINGLRANMGSETRSIATHLANDIAERMHANPLGVDASQYANIDSDNIKVDADASGCTDDNVPDPFCSSNSSTDATVVAATGECDSTEMAAFDAWVLTCGMPVDDGVKRGGVINQLMNGTASVTCNDAPCGLGSAHTITVNWSALNPNRSGDADNPEAETLTHSYTLVIVP